MKNSQIRYVDSLITIDEPTLSSSKSIDIVTDFNFIVKFIESNSIGIKINVDQINSEFNEAIFAKYGQIKRPFIFNFKIKESEKNFIYWKPREEYKIFILEADSCIVEFLVIFISTCLQQNDSGEYRLRKISK